MSVSAVSPRFPGCRGLDDPGRGSRAADDDHEEDEADDSASRERGSVAGRHGQKRSWRKPRSQEGAGFFV